MYVCKINCNDVGQLKFKQQIDERCIMERAVREIRRQVFLFIYFFFMARQL